MATVTTQAQVRKPRAARPGSGPWLVLFLALCGCANANDHPLPIFVSILPQASIVAEIGGPQVQVSVLVGPGHSPATYEPTPRQMATLARARLLLCAAVPFERGLAPKIMAMTQGPRLAGPRLFEPHLVETHLGGAAESDPHDHDHAADLDPHSWLDPQQAMAMADSACHHLSLLLPASAALFSTRRDDLRERLTSLDNEIRQTMTPHAGRQFFVFHPAYGHFARRYGLVQVAVEAGGHEPSARQLATVIDQAKAAGARVIVVQPQFSRRSAQAVARATGAEILVLDPLARDYEANLRHIASALAAALAPAP